MPRETSGVKTMVHQVLRDHGPIGIMHITKLTLGNDDPKLSEYDRRRSLVKHYLRQLVKEGVVDKTKYKNGYIYSLVRGERNGGR